MMKIEIETNNKLRRMSKKFLKNRVYIADGDSLEDFKQLNGFRRKDVFRVMGAMMMAYPDEVLKFFSYAGIVVTGEVGGEADEAED